jgi:DNA-binding protein
MSANDKDNIIYVGKKDLMAYVLAVTTQAGMNDEIKIKARGRSINKAVDVSQISINRFLKEWKITGTQIGTEERPADPEHPQERSGPQRISFIEITMSK